MPVWTVAIRVHPAGAGSTGAAGDAERADGGWRRLAWWWPVFRCTATPAASATARTPSASRAILPLWRVMAVPGRQPTPRRTHCVRGAGAKRAVTDHGRVAPPGTWTRVAPDPITVSPAVVKNTVTR